MIIKTRIKIKMLTILTLFFSMLFSTTVIAGEFTNPDTTNSNFVRWDAKVYAERWASYPGNTAQYHNYASEGGDCTNFASQVLRAGGMSMQGSPNYSYNSSWYYNGANTPYRSYSWTGVTNFMRHWANYNGSGYNRAYKFRIYSLATALSDSGYNTIYKDLYEGDIIQYKGNGGIDHSQVVHRYDSTDLYVAQHGTSSSRFFSNLKLKDYLTWVRDDPTFSNVTVYTTRIKKAVT